MSWRFFTARLGSPQSELGSIRLGEPDCAFVADALALAVTESAVPEIPVAAADTAALSLSEIATTTAGIFDILALSLAESISLEVNAGAADTVSLSLLTTLTTATAVAAADTLAIALGEIANQSLTTAPGAVLVDQQAIELVFAVIPQARLDQLALETVLAPLNPNVRLAQAALETVYAGSPSALLDQLAVELILKRGGGTAYVSGSVPANITSFVY